MLLDRRAINRLEERLFHGARPDQEKVALEYHPKVRQDRDEAERTASATRHNWHTRNAEWGEATVPVPPAGTGEGHPYDREPFERSEDTRLAVLFRSLGWVATGFELVTAGYGAQFWLDVSPPGTAPPGPGLHLSPAGAAAIGVTVAAVYTYLAKSLWGIGPQDHSNHRPEFKRRERLVWIVGAGNLALLGSLGVVRFLDVSETVYFVQLGGLSALLPIFASGCFVLARLISERNRLAAEYWSIRSHGERLQTILGRIREVLGLRTGEEEHHD